MNNITFTLSSLQSLHTLYTDDKGLELKISQPTLRVWFDSTTHEVSTYKFIIPYDDGKGTKAQWTLINQYEAK